MKTTLLLDSDIIAYGLAASGETRVKWGDDDGEVDQITVDFSEIKAGLDRRVSELMRKLRGDDVIVCLSCDRADNWRKAVLPSYKENRAGTLKPVFLGAAKDYLAEQYQAYRRPRLEADDIMGILSTHPTLVPGKKIIVSEDKDMAQIPGWLFNPAKDTAPRLITEAQADRFHLWQTLVGDTSDGYPGAPGIGPKKADAILEAAGTDWRAVVHAYMDVMVRRAIRDEQEPPFFHDAEAAALVQARVARICRHTDYDFAKKEVILWTP